VGVEVGGVCVDTLEKKPALVNMKFWTKHKREVNKNRQKQDQIYIPQTHDVHSV
jgi:hypothetical protein